MSHRFSVAPMMDWTDRHCRFLHRQSTRHSLLYTEMVTADAILRGNKEKLLGFDRREDPVALQIGGSEPVKLAEAATIGEGFGYSEINLNVGCPSDRVQSGRFGACLMQEPELVAECVKAMRDACSIPVTVKCRIGVDDQDPEKALRDVIGLCARVGVKTFAVHARKAWLEGLSPKENRDVPPLDYALVYRVKQEHPKLKIVLNGGIATLDEAQAHLEHVDGVMLGRAAYHSPAILTEVDARFFGGEPVAFEVAVEAYVQYAAEQLEQRVPLNRLTKPMLGLFNGRQGARLFRRHLAENGNLRGANLQTLRDALALVQPHQDREAA